MPDDEKPDAYGITKTEYEAVHEVKDRITEFERGMSDDKFASQVDEGKLMSFLLDYRTSTEFSIKVALPQGFEPSAETQQYVRNYERQLADVSKAINGNTAGSGCFL